MPSSAHQTLVPFQAFEAADGWLVVACPKETLWRGLCDALGESALADDERFADLAARDRNRDTLLPLLQEAFARRTVAEWIELMSVRKVPCAPVNDIAGALADPQAAARDAVVEVRASHPWDGSHRRQCPSARRAPPVTGKGAVPRRALGADPRAMCAATRGSASRSWRHSASSGMAEATVNEP